MIVTGYLSADRIEAGSITATKLDGTVGATIDLSDNESIKMIVEGATSIYKSDTEPESPETNMLWLDTSGEIDILKRWNGESWVETTISQTDLDALYSEVGTSRSEILQMSSEISHKVSTEVFNAEMGNKADESWVSQQLETVISQTTQDITFYFNQSKDYTAEATAPLNEFKEEVQAYQRFTADGQELGAVDSPFMARLGTTKLSFLQDGSEVAYISNNKMYITEARVTEKLSIGTEDNGYFDWVTTASGLALKWRG